MGTKQSRTPPPVAVAYVTQPASVVVETVMDVKPSGTVCDLPMPKMVTAKKIEQRMAAQRQAKKKENDLLKDANTRLFICVMEYFFENFDVDDEINGQYWVCPFRNPDGLPVTNDTCDMTMLYKWAIDCGFTTYQTNEQRANVPKANCVIFHLNSPIKINNNISVVRSQTVQNHALRKM